MEGGDGEDDMEGGEGEDNIEPCTGVKVVSEQYFVTGIRSDLTAVRFVPMSHVWGEHTITPE